MPKTISTKQWETIIKKGQKNDLKIKRIEQQNRISRSKSYKLTEDGKRDYP